jgi:hypothetical protein
METNGQLYPPTGLIPGKSPPDTHSIEWAPYGRYEEEKVLPLPRIKPPLSSLSLYRLSYSCLLKYFLWAVLHRYHYPGLYTVKWEPG